MNLSSKIYYLKKLVQFLLPISLLSLFLIPQSYSSLLYSYNQLLSKFSSKNTVERNCIFLVFNGILALIIKASGLIGHIAEPVGPSKGVSIPLAQDQRLRFSEEAKARIVKKIEEDVDVPLESDQEEEEEQEQEEDEVMYDIDVGEENEKVHEKEEEEEGLDELHKKCDNFIKKVRQEIYGL